MSFLCTLRRKLCHWYMFLCTIHRKCLPIFDKMLNFHLEPRPKILSHFKDSECEIAFLKFHFLLDIIMWKLWIITLRRKWNFKKAISHSEPLKWARILVLGFKWKFNVFQKIGKNYLRSVHRNLCTMHRFLCTVHRIFLAIYGKMLNFHLDPRTKILAHFNGSECEIAFLKFHFLLNVIMWKL